jgi:hypothetical protein
VNPQLPVVEGVGTLARGGLAGGDLEPLSRKRLRALYPDARLICDFPDVLRYALELFEVRARELDSGVLRRCSSWTAS